MAAIDSRESSSLTNMRTRTHYIPVHDAQVGMLLAESVKDSFARSMFPMGLQLSEENLHQLLAHQIEYICVTEQDSRNDTVVADDAAHSAKDVLDIFEHADLTDPAMAALFNQVLTYRSA
jgi:hypothetical protein